MVLLLSTIRKWYLIGIHYCTSLLLSSFCDVMNEQMGVMHVSGEELMKSQRRRRTANALITICCWKDGRKEGRKEGS